GRLLQAGGAAAVKLEGGRPIVDVVKRYDIDGVHFDDYFYPYIEKDAEGKDIDFPDDRNWKIYLTDTARRNQKPMSRSDWRRKNVNDFIVAVGRGVKRLKPQVMFGISPFGIYRPMPELGIEGFDAYEGLYADSKRWLQEGWVDYFAPQLYWETARKAQSFPVLLKWWNEQNVKARHIWPGLASYRIGRNENWGARELTNQIQGIRGEKSSPGQIYFNFKSLRNDQGGVQNELLKRSYGRRALIPVSPWIKALKLRSPSVGPAKRDAAYYRASWKPVKGAFWYVVYAKDKEGWSYSILPAGETSITLSADRIIDNLVVHAVDRLGNESR
ncbi:MAG: family 10 glycosylhydrolase, partial [Pyrinomonadaceae bacterium]